MVYLFMVPKITSYLDPCWSRNFNTSDVLLRRLYHCLGIFFMVIFDAPHTKTYRIWHLKNICARHCESANPIYPNMGWISILNRPSDRLSPVWGNCSFRYEIFIHSPVVDTLTQDMTHRICPLIAKSMGPTWGPPGSCRPHMGPMLAPWTLLSGEHILWELPWGECHG